MTPAGDDRPFIFAHGQDPTLPPVRYAAWALALLAAASLVPATGAAPTVPELITGVASASTLRVHGLGPLVVEGGAFDWNEVCGPCDIRLTATSTGFTTVGTLASSEPSSSLPPGLYDITEFRGLLAYNIEGDNAFFVTLHGVGDVERIETVV